MSAVCVVHAAATSGALLTSVNDSLTRLSPLAQVHFLLTLRKTTAPCEIITSVDWVNRWTVPRLGQKDAMRADLKLRYTGLTSLESLRN